VPSGIGVARSSGPSGLEGGIDCQTYQSNVTRDHGCRRGAGPLQTGRSTELGSLREAGALEKARRLSILNTRTGDLWTSRATPANEVTLGPREPEPVLELPAIPVSVDLYSGAGILWQCSRQIHG